ncbi:MAG: 3,4-dihydroxy 2-butanone 4-phosphate synthase / GTP cyclohydrolase II [Parcubacteria group bacterium Gr01-1014_31]|nr:MAG: 3,4-dihydroxy 2-butanone 4-phosphate synthase / GTP cyclohydrolase II [Parcubacteria group bacterium Gr01-1014_31]
MASSLAEILQAARSGKPALILDHADREGEADLFFPAAKASPELVNFLITEGRGLLCAPLTTERALALELPLMVPQDSNREAHRCQFTVSVDAARDIGSGISAADRALTLRRLTEVSAAANDFVRPGHVFPLISAGGGIAERDGHTEAAIATCRLAELPPVGVICELINADGTMARGHQVSAFADRHRLPIIEIAELAAAAATLPTLPTTQVRRLASAQLPTAFGNFSIHVFSAADGKEHVALTCGDVQRDTPIPVRLHSQCLTGDTFHSLKCDCRQQLHAALREIAAAGAGVLLYLNQEGRGIGLANKIRAYALQETGMDTVEANLALGLAADARDFSVAAELLVELGVRAATVLTNNPAKLRPLSARGIAVTSQSLTAITPENRRYLKAKVAKLGHRIPTLD